LLTVVELNETVLFSIPVADNVAVKNCTFEIDGNKIDMQLSQAYCKNCAASASHTITALPANTIPKARVFCYDFASKTKTFKYFLVAFQRATEPQ